MNATDFQVGDCVTLKRDATNPNGLRHGEVCGYEAPASKNAKTLVRVRCANGLAYSCDPAELELVP